MSELRGCVDRVGCVDVVHEGVDLHEMEKREKGGEGQSKRVY